MIDKEEMKKRKKKYLDRYTPNNIKAKDKSERDYKLISEAKKDGDSIPNKALENIPKSVLTNLNNLPDSNITKEKSKLIDINIKPDGSCESKVIIMDGNEKDSRSRGIAGIISPSDNELFKIEQKRIKNNNINELAERTLEKHKDQDYWEEVKQKIDKKEIKVKIK